MREQFVAGKRIKDQKIVVNSVILKPSFKMQCSSWTKNSDLLKESLEDTSCTMSWRDFSFISCFLMALTMKEMIQSKRPGEVLRISLQSTEDLTCSPPAHYCPPRSRLSSGSSCTNTYSIFSFYIPFHTVFNSKYKGLMTNSTIVANSNFI